MLTADMDDVVIDHGELGGVAAQRLDHRLLTIGQIEPLEPVGVGIRGDFDKRQAGGLSSNSREFVSPN